MPTRWTLRHLFVSYASSLIARTQDEVAAVTNSDPLTQMTYT